MARRGRSGHGHAVLSRPADSPAAAETIGIEIPWTFGAAGSLRVLVDGMPHDVGLGPHGGGSLALANAVGGDLHVRIDPPGPLPAATPREWRPRAWPLARRAMTEARDRALPRIAGPAEPRAGQSRGSRRAGDRGDVRRRRALAGRLLVDQALLDDSLCRAARAAQAAAGRAGGRERPSSRATDRTSPGACAAAATARRSGAVRAAPARSRAADCRSGHSPAGSADRLFAARRARRPRAAAACATAARAPGRAAGTGGHRRCSRASGPSTPPRRTRTPLRARAPSGAPDPRSGSRSPGRRRGAARARPSSARPRPELRRLVALPAQPFWTTSGQRLGDPGQVDVSGVGPENGGGRSGGGRWRRVRLASR